MKKILALVMILVLMSTAAVAMADTVKIGVFEPASGDNGAGGKQETTDRYLSMPMARTRILGVQLYLGKIEGFLHWGYNYYHNQFSYDYVDVLSCTDGDYFAPAGDTCLVIPERTIRFGKPCA